MVERRLDRREGRPGLLQADQDADRRQRDPDARSGDARRTARASRRACRRSKRPAPSNRHAASASRTLFLGKDKRRRIPARDARPDARLHRQDRAGHRVFNRRRRSRDAVGLRLGTGPVRDDERDRHPRTARRAGSPADGARAFQARCPNADGRRAGRRAQRFRDGPPCAGGAGPADSPLRQGSAEGGAQERRRKPRGSRRRRPRARVPLEDERDRRRHGRDDPRRRARGRGELPGARRRQRTAANTSPPAPT